MSESGKLITSTDLGGFFREELTQARQELGMALNDDAEHYLVNLLCEFSVRDVRPTPGEEPLALMYKRALETTPDEQMRVFKDLGDVALYVSGFFAEFVEKSLVDVGYYISMGGSAYTSVSHLFANRRQGDSFGVLYEELADRFTEMVDLLNQVSERSMMTRSANSDEALLRLYDRWTKTGSDRVRRLLLERGMLPQDDISDEYIQ